METSPPPPRGRDQPEVANEDRDPSGSHILRKSDSLPDIPAPQEQNKPRSKNFILIELLISYLLKHIRTSFTGDFPGGPVVKNMSSDTEEDVGSIPGPGTKIPHAPGQLSPCASTTEPTGSDARRKEEPVHRKGKKKDPACYNADPTCRN